MKKNNKENMGVDFEPEIEKMNVKELFEYSGLSRCAWCEALGNLLFPATYSQYQLPALTSFTYVSGTT